MTEHYLPAGPGQPPLHGDQDGTTGAARDRGVWVRVGLGLGWEHTGYIGELRIGEVDQLQDGKEQD